MFGILGGALIKNRFDNISKVDKIGCPTLIIHGKNDDFIKQNHAEEIYEKMKCKVFLHINTTMNHDPNNFLEHVYRPVQKFLERIEFCNGAT